MMVNVQSPRFGRIRRRCLELVRESCRACSSSRLRLATLHTSTLRCSDLLGEIRASEQIFGRLSEDARETTNCLGAHFGTGTSGVADGSVGAVSVEHPNADLINRFYMALGASNGIAMAACYAPGASFEDPAFGKLDSDDAGAMWRMLTSRARDLTVEVSGVTADDRTGSARWIARYTFTQTGRPVLNDVRASFRFVDGLIVEHHDRFDWWRWARQALGWPGLLLGWNPLFHNAARNKARGTLAEFRRREATTSATSPGTGAAPASS
jgi:hypothetical protein